MIATDYARIARRNAPERRAGHLRRLHADQRGQALVEFALVLPLLFVVIFAITDFGAAYNYKNDVTHLANQAARYAAVSNCGLGCTSVEQAVKDAADSNGLRNGSGDVSTGTDQPLVVCIDFPTGSTGLKGQPVRATVETNYRFLPYLNLSKVRIYAQATLRIDQAYVAVGPSKSPYTPVGVVGQGGNCPSYAS